MRPDRLITRAAQVEAGPQVLAVGADLLSAAWIGQLGLHRIEQPFLHQRRPRAHLAVDLTRVLPAVDDTARIPRVSEDRPNARWAPRPPGPRRHSLRSQPGDDAAQRVACVEPGEHLPYYRSLVLDHHARHRVPGKPRSRRRLTVLCPMERGEVLPAQGGDVVVALGADDHEAPGIGDPLLIGQLVSDTMLIPRLVEADPGIPCAADNLGLHDVLS